MSEPSKELLNAARSLVGSNFVRHYVGGDPCMIKNGGDLTNPVCFERGLGQNNAYDCMGMVIGSTCLVLGCHLWPTSFRHVEQFDSLAEARPAEPGDALVIYDRYDWPRHMGIIRDPKTGLYVHATSFEGASGKKIEGVIEDEMPAHYKYKCISLDQLAAAAELAVMPSEDYNLAA